MRKVILAYDIGGTKVIAGLFDPTLTPFLAEPLCLKKEKVTLQDGPNGFYAQLKNMGETLLKHQGLSVKNLAALSIGSAGPLDRITGTLMNPTNLKTGKKHWGVVGLKDNLTRLFSCKTFYLENDADAAALAEFYLGAAQGCKNFATFTLGTGLGTAFFANGEIVRSGRGLHPEAGHVLLNFKDKKALCGCGQTGCAEAYLSGTGFSNRARLKCFPKGKKLKAEEIERLARKKDKRAIAAFDEYALYFAEFVLSMVVLYSPEKIVLAGSMAHSSDLFLEKSIKHLEKLLLTRRDGIDLMPEFFVSPLDSLSILKGAALRASLGTRVS